MHECLLRRLRLSLVGDVCAADGSSSRAGRRPRATPTGAAEQRCARGGDGRTSCAAARGDGRSSPVVERRSSSRAGGLGDGIGRFRQLVAGWFILSREGGTRSVLSACAWWPPCLGAARGGDSPRRGCCTTVVDPFPIVSVASWAVRSPGPGASVQARGAAP